MEDARRFDAFLKENDLRVQQAIRAGEHEAKRKNEKAAEIKRLAADIVVAEAALSKREEAVARTASGTGVSRQSDARRVFLRRLTAPGAAARRGGL